VAAVERQERDEVQQADHDVDGAEPQQKRRCRAEVRHHQLGIVAQVRERRGADAAEQKEHDAERETGERPDDGADELDARRCRLAFEISLQ